MSEFKNYLESYQKREMQLDEAFAGLIMEFYSPDLSIDRSKNLRAQLHDLQSWIVLHYMIEHGYDFIRCGDHFGYVKAEEKPCQNN